MDWQDIEWFTAVERAQTPLFIDLLIKGQSNERIFMNTGFNFSFSNILKDGLRLAYDKKEVNALGKYIRMELSKNDNNVFENFSRRCLKSCKSCIDYTSTFSKEKFSFFSNAELESICREYFNVIIDHASFLMTMIVIEPELERYFEYNIENISKKNKCMHDVDEIKQALLVPSEQTYASKNVTTLFEIGSLIQNNSIYNNLFYSCSSVDDLVNRLPNELPEVWQQICEFQDEYAWMGRLYYDGESLGIKDILLRIQNILKSDCKKKLTEIYKRMNNRIKSRKDALTQLNNDDAMIKVANLISLYLHLRTYRLDVFFISHENMIGLFKTISNRCQIPYEKIVYLRCDEIYQLLQVNDTYKFHKVSSKRRNMFSVTVLDNVTTWRSVHLTAPKCRVTYSQPNTLLELEGICANTGPVVEGFARIVLIKDDMIYMENGEILITTNILPSFLAAVEKASAIVTNEGGILSHTANISQQLDIPCVMSTKYATETFKTGDHIVVDAENGIVRKVTEAQKFTLLIPKLEDYSLPKPMHIKETLSDVQIFLSYSQEDKEKVKSIYDKLSDEGFKPWMNTQNLLPGENTIPATDKAIRQSEIFVACLSSNSVRERGNFQRELKKAQEIFEEYLSNDIYLIPVRLNNCEIPIELEKFKCVDLFQNECWNKESWKKFRNAILLALKRKRKNK